MKILLTTVIFGLTLQSHAISEQKVDQIANSIWVIEGGHRTRYPYGIKIKTKDPRRVCENTIRNNYWRWVDSGRPGLFLDWLADVYCHDDVGNRNWKKNIRAILKGGAF